MVDVIFLWVHTAVDMVGLPRLLALQSANRFITGVFFFEDAFIEFPILSENVRISFPIGNVLLSVTVS
jgi:hypothetical protein